MGFERSIPLFILNGDRYETNSLKLSYFNFQSFSAKKDSKTIRIFCMGGSTTFGHPYEDPVSFCGWLREMLKEAKPEQTWEVVNCGGVSYASYRIALLMQELTQYEPDLFIIYTGHNEFLEARSYAELREPGLLQRSGRIVSKLRISGLIDSLVGHSETDEKTSNRLAAEVDVILDHTDGPETYKRDPQLKRGVGIHFRDSLLRIIALARTAGAEVILVKPESNLRHFSPFKSESLELSFGDSVRKDKLLREGREKSNSGDLAGASSDFLAASELDPHNAAVLFETGATLWSAERYVEAHEYYKKARDEDVCPLRAPSEITECVSDVATKLKVPLVDFQTLMAGRTYRITGQRIPGDECFLDHVHPTIEANGDLAVALFEEIQELNLIVPGRAPEKIRDLVRNRVTGNLDNEEQALALTRVAQVLAWAGKDEEGLGIARKAVELCSTNSFAVTQLGRMLEKNGKMDDAFAQYETAVRLNPADSAALSRLAGACFMRKQTKAALKHWKDAIRYTPESAPLSFRVELHVRIGDCHALLGDASSALSEYAIARRLDPNAPIAKERLSPSR